MNYKKAFNEAAQYYFTVVLVFLNIVIFLICTFTGNLLYNKGAFYVGNVFIGREYYRVLSAAFLHFDIQHLANNMILLFFIGRIIEKHIGHMKYIIIYLLSGIGGNLFSAFWEIKTAQYSVSAGASGAVFGLTGALLVLVLLHKGKLEGIRWQGVVIMILLSVYNGFTTDNVNNEAHLGGLAIGIIVTFIVSTIENQYLLRRQRIVR